MFGITITYYNSVYPEKALVGSDINSDPNEIWAGTYLEALKECVKRQEGFERDGCLAFRYAPQAIPFAAT